MGPSRELDWRVRRLSVLNRPMETNLHTVAISAGILAVRCETAARVQRSG
jgi:hypothetical protein